MPRRPKDYRVSAAQEVLTALPNLLEVRFTDEWGETGRLFDFRSFNGRKRLAGDLALAFRHYGASKTPGTRCTIYDSIRRWFKFLDETRSSTRSACDVDIETLRAYLAWLDRSERAPRSRIGRYGYIKCLLSWLKRHRPDLVSSELTFPFAPLAQRRNESKHRAVLSRGEIEAVLAAARADIEKNWRAFTTASAAIAAASNRDLPDAAIDARDLGDLGTLLAVISARYGGVIPRDALLAQTRSGRAIRKAIRCHGGITRLSPLLHATVDTLTPYLLVMGASLYANPTSLLAMTRDCMVEHVLLEARHVIVWKKVRAGRIQRRSFMRGRALSVPNLVDQLLALTAPLVPRAHKRYQHLLFLCRATTQTAFIYPYPLTFAQPVRAFVRRHGLTAESGAPLPLKLSSLRGTGLGLAHAALGGDIRKTQILANHADPSTTAGYVDGAALRRANAEAIGRLQTQFVASIRAGVLTHATRAPGHVSLNADHVSASGFSCRNPMEGVAPGQRRGELCTAWLGCFTCPNAVIPLKPDVLARLLAMREALIEARKALPDARWNLVYGPKLEVLDRDILPKFPTGAYEAAARMLPDTFKPPRLE